jgi:hypothetical protein
VPVAPKSSVRAFYPGGARGAKSQSAEVVSASPAPAGPPASNASATASPKATASRQVKDIGEQQNDVKLVE